MNIYHSMDIHPVGKYTDAFTPTLTSARIRERSCTLKHPPIQYTPTYHLPPGSALVDITFNGKSTRRIFYIVIQVFGDYCLETAFKHLSNISETKHKRKRLCKTKRKPKKEIEKKNNQNKH